MIGLESERVSGEPLPPGATANLPEGVIYNPATSAEDWAKHMGIDSSKTPTKAGWGKGVKDFLFGNPEGNFGKAIFQGAAWAATAYIVIPLVADLLGLKPETTKALQSGVSAGLFTTGIARGFAEKTFVGGNPFLIGA